MPRRHKRTNLSFAERLGGSCTGAAAAATGSQSIPLFAVPAAFPALALPFPFAMLTAPRRQYTVNPLAVAVLTYERKASEV